MCSRGVKCAHSTHTVGGIEKPSGASEKKTTTDKKNSTPQPTNLFSHTLEHKNCSQKTTCRRAGLAQKNAALARGDGGGGATI